METIIKRKIKPSQMVNIFENGKVNIRWYEPTDEKKSIIGQDKPIFYSVRIRHNEDQDANVLFIKALKETAKLKTFNIESRLTRTETIQIQAKTRKEAIEAAEQAEGRFWESDGRGETRQLISIS